MAELRIDSAEAFEILAQAPIVEAVIDIRVENTEPTDEAKLKAAIGNQLRGYFLQDSMHTILFEQSALAGAPETYKSSQQMTWKGLRYCSDDKTQIVQFNKDGLVFSRLTPYETWDRFVGAALDLWGQYRAILNPRQITRIGLRYINRIPFREGESQLGAILDPAPQTPRGLDLPLANFYTQETYVVPNYPYVVNLIRTLQEPSPPAIPTTSVIVDIDAFTADNTVTPDAQMHHRLRELRWLKNKVFFGCLSEKGKQQLRGGNSK